MASWIVCGETTSGEEAQNGRRQVGAARPYCASSDARDQSVFVQEISPGTEGFSGKAGVLSGVLGSNTMFPSYP